MNDEQEIKPPIEEKEEIIQAKKAEKYFLEGPHSRVEEFWFVLKILMQFIKAFRTLHFVGPCVTVFGSARLADTHPYYQMAREMGQELSKIGFTVMTGGGPGIMEAANRGAKDVGGRSVGCNIVLNFEQKPNLYLDKWVRFDHFFVRKVVLIKYSYAFIVMPGGVGTMDELFEAITLIQTKKIRDFPVVIMGKAFWAPLIEQLQLMINEKTMSSEDMNLLLITDSVTEAIAHIQQHAVIKYGLKRYKVPQPSAILGEKNL